MARLSELIPAKLAHIEVSGNSLCVSRAKSLNSEKLGTASITKTPEEITKAVLTNHGFGLTVHERKLLPNLILQTSYDEYQDSFAREVIKSYSKNHQFWRRLFRSWLLEYNPSGIVGNIVIIALKQNIDKLPRNLQAIAERYPILSMSPDFGGVAITLLNNEISREDLSSLGLSEGGNATTRLAQEILFSCVQLLMSARATEQQLKEFRNLVGPSGKIHDSVRMFAMVGLIMGTVQHASDKILVKEISSLIEENFDDPVAQKDRWPSVPETLGGNITREQCLNTVRKWQVFRSITLFFKIIDQVVESEHKHHFPVRRQFWLNYFDKGEVTDAWVILGSKAREKMRQLVKEGGDDYRVLRWASLTGGPSDQCALLMKLGTTTVMEFSHSGKVRIWGANDRTKGIVPNLHKSQYQAENLRADCPPDQMFTHDANGLWRNRTQKCIQKLAGNSVKL